MSAASGLTLVRSARALAPAASALVRDARRGLWWQVGAAPSLRLVLASMLGILGLASTLALTAAVTRSASARLEAEIGAQLSEVAGHMAGFLDRGLFERWRDLQVAASLDAVRGAPASPEAGRAVLERLHETFPDYALIGLISPEGRVLVTSNRLLEGADVARRDYFLAGRERPYVGDVHDALLLAKLLPRPREEPLRLVDLATPVRTADGALVGVLGAHLDWAWARDLGRSLALSLRGRRQGAEILVLAGDGTVLLGPPPLQGRRLPEDLAAALRRGEAARTTWPDDPDVYLAALEPTRGYRDYPGLGWSVVVRQRADRALAAVDDLRWNILLPGSLIALAAALLAWIAAGRLARPLHELARSAATLGRDAPPPAPPVPLVREVRAVAEALRAASGELHRREAARRLLIDELNHRVKNTLATVQSLAIQSFRNIGGPGTAQARSVFDARLFALAGAHDVLTRESWSGAELDAVVAEVVRPHHEAGGGARVEAGGPCVRLDPRTALALSMALHELCTNAAKYGALSTATGRVAITWWTTPEGAARRLHLQWRERGGPAVSPPARTGFGSRLIERNLAAELQGQAAIRYEPDGVTCAITALIVHAEG